MCSHQDKNVSKELYKRVYVLNDGKKLIISNPELGDEEELINQMKTVDSETRFLTREPGEFDFTLEQEREFIKNTLNNDHMQFLIGEIDGRIIANCSVGVISNNKRYRQGPQWALPYVRNVGIRVLVRE